MAGADGQFIGSGVEVRLHPGQAVVRAFERGAIAGAEGGERGSHGADIVAQLVQGSWLNGMA